MKKICFVVGISLVYLVLASVISSGKAVVLADSRTEEIQGRFGESFLGWSKSSSEENLIAVFRGAGPAMDYIKEFVSEPQSNCDKAVFITPQVFDWGQQCKGLKWSIDFNQCEGKSDYVEFTKCNRFWVSNELLSKITTKCNKEQDCYNRIHKACVIDNKVTDGQNYITPEKFKDITTCIENQSASQQSATLPTTYRVSQLNIQKQCADAFGTNYRGNIAELTTDINVRCIPGVYEECITKPKYTDKELKDDPILTPNQFNTAKGCIPTAIANIKNSAAKAAAPTKIAAWELYWETSPSKRLVYWDSKNGPIPDADTVDLSKNDIDPDFNKIGTAGKDYKMTLYLYFRERPFPNNEGCNTTNENAGYCKKISFTILYTPSAAGAGTGAGIGGAAGTCTPKVISCTGRCKLAGCAEGQGEGSIQFCQANGQYGPATGACVTDCKDKCSEDGKKLPTDFDITKTRDCTYSQSCQGNGTMICKGKMINNKCTDVQLSGYDCGPCILPKVCTPGAYDVTCQTPNKCGCGQNSGVAIVKQCKSDGSGWGDSHFECSSKCADLCGGGVPQNGTPCRYPEQCSTGGAHTCAGTIQGGVCKYDPAVDPACTACQ